MLQEVWQGLKSLLDLVMGPLVTWWEQFLWYGSRNQISIPCASYLNSHWILSLLLLLSFPFSVALLSIFFLVLDRLHSLQINSSLSTYSLVDSVGNTKTCKIWFLFQGGGSKGEKGSSLSTYYVPGTLCMITPLILTTILWGNSMPPTFCIRKGN